MTATPTRTALGWDYSPAPEATDHIRLSGALRPVHRRRLAGEPRPTSRRSTRRPRSRWPRSRRPARPTSTPRSRPRARRCRAGSAARARARQVPVPDRAADPGARARAGDRRVARRRQADPRVARRRRPARRRALLLLRGLGRQAALRPRGPRRRAARRGRPDRAVELPAADGGLEARAGARLRQHRGAQAGRDDAADRAAAGRDLPGGRAAGRRGQHHHRRRRGRRRARAPPRDRQGRLHRLDRVGKDIQAALAGRDVGLTLELGGKSANIVFEDAAIDQAVEGIVDGIFFNQGHVCCAGSRLLLQESVAEEVVAKLWARMERLRVGDPLDKNTDVGAINSAAQLAADRGARRRRRARGRDAPLDHLRAARERLLVPADAVHRRRARVNRIAVEEIFGPVVSVTTFRTQAEAIERANNSAYGLAAGVWTDKGSRRWPWRAPCGPASSGRTPTTSSTRRRRSAATRRAASAARAAPSGLRPYVRIA